MGCSGVGQRFLDPISAQVAARKTSASFLQRNVTIDPLARGRIVHTTAKQERRVTAPA